MDQKKSIIRIITSKMWVAIFLMLLIAFGLITMTWVITRQEAERDVEYLLNIYSSQLENRLTGIERVLTGILEEQGQLTMLSDEDENNRTYAAVSLKNTLASLLRTENNVADQIIIAQHEPEYFIAEGSHVPYDIRLTLIRNTQAEATAASGISGMWKTEAIGDNVWLCRCITRRNLAIHLYLKVDTLLDVIQASEKSDSQWALLGENGTVYAVKGTGTVAHWLSRSYSFHDAPFSLRYNEGYQRPLHQLRMEAVFLILAAILLSVFMLLLRRYLKRELFVPMKALEADMRRIQQGEYQLRVANSAHTEEFSELTDTFNHLLDEVLNLRIKEYEKQLALQEADQKYIRLQLRPHFFLNAMTTVSALSAKGKNQEIQAYIESLSKNIRYMFSAGLHTVPIQDEIQHVQNYLKMQEMKYPDCVFSYIDLPEELSAWRIPQMLIHTLVENEYKYAVSRDVMLMLVIQVSTVQCEGEEMLMIRVEDDGKGYPQEVIDQMNSSETQEHEGGERVGLWSLKRLLELMYERKGLFTLSNREPHGAVATILVPKETVHER